MSDAPMTKSWQEIIARYEAIDTPGRSIRAIAMLARQISESPLAAGLFAWTSMFDMCIVQQQVTYPYRGPFLRVSPANPGRGTFGDQVEFRYEDTPITADQWHRTVEADEVMPRLLKFLDQLHWFPANVLGPLRDKKS